MKIDIEWTSGTGSGFQRGWIRPQQLPAIVDMEFERAVNDYIRRLLKRLERNLRVRSPKRTGRLASSWNVYSKGRFRIKRSRPVIQITNTQPYARWLDRSRRSPHEGFLERIVRQTIAENNV